MVAALLAVLSSVLWGSADFGGGLAARRLPAVAVVGWTQSFALLVVGSIALLSGGFGGPRGWIAWAVLAGLTGAFGLIAFYTALSVGTMGVVSPIAALGAVVPVIGGLLAGDSPSGLQFVGMALGLAGAVTASGPELRGRPSAGLGAGSEAGPGTGSGAGPGAGRRSVALAGLSGLLFGLALLGLQRGALVDPVLTVAGIRATQVTLFVGTALALRSVGGVRAPDLPGLALIGVADVSANLLFAYASTRGLTSVVAVLGALYPVATVLLGALVLHERMLRVQRLGVLLALAGIVLLALA